MSDSPVEAKTVAYGIAAIALVGAGGYIVYKLTRGPEVANFKDLTCEYWSDAATGVFLPGQAIPAIEGWSFGGTLHFKHRGPGGKFQVGFWVNVEGEKVWAGPKLVDVSKSDEWISYKVDVEGIFERGSLVVCRRVDTVKVIASEDGTPILEDGDAECYHVAELPAPWVESHERAWYAFTK